MKESDKNRSIVAEVIAHAWRDPQYLGKLRQNPKLMLENAGIEIPLSMDVTLLENTPTVINVILPSQVDNARYEGRMQKATEMLKDLPEDMEVHVHRDSTARAFFVIPQAPAQASELSDRQLEAVVGGKGAPKKPIFSEPNPNPFPGGSGGTQDFAVAVNNAMVNTNVAVNIEANVNVVGYAADVAVVLAAVVAVIAPCFIS